MKDINHILDFMVELDKLKSVLRKSRPVGLDRYENSAEHSWHVCLSALMLKDHANESVDIGHVIKMLLIHDLGEIDAGDVIVYASETAERQSAEEQGVRRLMNMLPDTMGDEYVALWREFEAGVTPESKFAKAIDRIPPLLQNIQDNGHGWKKNNISKDKVFDLNSKRISAGSAAIWSAIEAKLHQAVENGILQ